jgi:hypothetical protein
MVSAKKHVPIVKKRMSNPNTPHPPRNSDDNIEGEATRGMVIDNM